jgi:hypothetical protein
MTRTAGRLLGALTLSALALSGCTVVHAPAKGASRPASRSVPVPARPVATKYPVSGPIPPAVRVVTISQQPWANAGRRPPAPVTITDRSEVARIWALVQALPPYPGGIYYCPMDRGGTVVLAFSAAAGGPALAVVAAGLSGCAFVNLTAGQRHFPLGPGGAGPTLAGEVFRVAGLHWTVNPPPIVQG